MKSTAPVSSEVHQIELPWGTCSFILKRSKRRSVGFLISDDGLRISAPMRLSIPDLKKIIHTKSGWIEQRLKLWEKRQRQTAPLEELLNKGVPIPIRGEAYQVELLPAGSKAMLNPWTKTIALPQASSPGQHIKTVEKVLKNHAREVFSHMAAQLVARQETAKHLPAFTLHLSSPSSRWGSCNTKREVRLNWRLVHYPVQMIEYVIAHELAHLVEMNHSPRFWAVVENLMPDYKEPHKKLATMNPGEVPLI